jgi:hypothetical protein
MPQASEELRAKMEEYFGDPIDTAGPIKFLIDAGYDLTNDFMWQPKLEKRASGSTEKELECINFLIDEWDFGGITKP